MKTLIKTAVAVLFSIALFTAFVAAKTPAIFAADPETVRPHKHLKPFTSERELKNYLKRLVKKRGVGYGSGNGSGVGDGAGLSMSTNVTVSAGAPGAKSQDESITNTQHAGVDEGGIVKLHGDHLVVLRRGRLFTVAIGDNTLKAVSSINAFGPDIDPSDTWYDEMLISDNNIVVVGYSYDRGGTEIGLFKIDEDGRLTYRSTYHLRSNDYYSSRNYSSRLIGNRLIFYSPLYLEWDEKNILDEFPALRKWHKGAKTSEFRRIVSAEHVYRAEKSIVDENELALHTVTTCDLSGYEMKCDARTVLGPSGNVFYVSPGSVYVWASDWDGENEKQRNRSIIFKMPLNGNEPGALRVSGSPVDQFSFLEDEGSNLNVLVRSESDGDGMWSSEVSTGETALLRLPAISFGDGSAVAAAFRYQELEKVAGDSFQNRFVGNYLLYGTGSGWGSPKTTTENKLHLVNWQTGTLSNIVLSHNVDRIDALGNDGIVVGTSDNDLVFTSVRLDNLPRVIDTYRIKSASQGETRSQGFFYKPDGADSGMLGLPITYAARPGYEQLREGSASIIFLRNNSLRFNELGLLASGLATTPDDDCKASCVDWYGNARPIFARGRIFALLGYEMVEGEIRSNQIEEVRRLDFSPKPISSAAR